MEIFIAIGIGVMALGIVGLFWMVSKYTTPGDRDEMHLPTIYLKPRMNPRRWNFFAGKWKTGMEINKYQKENFNYIFKAYAIFINVVFFIYIPLFDSSIIQLAPSLYFFITSFLALNSILYMIHRFKWLRLLNLIYHLNIGFFLLSLLLYYVEFF